MAKQAKPRATKKAAAKSGATKSRKGIGAKLAEIPVESLAIGHVSDEMKAVLAYLGDTLINAAQASRPIASHSLSRFDRMRELMATPELPVSGLPEAGRYANLWPTETALQVDMAAASAPPTEAYASTFFVAQERLPTRLAAVPQTTRAISEMATNINPDMDPRLQLAVANRAMGKRGVSLASTTEDEVAVIARVTSVADWNEAPDVLPGAELGQAADGTYLVTGRIPIARIEEVRAHPVVQSLKASQVVYPSLVKTVETMGVAPNALPAAVDPAGGEGVVVGIVDFGCDFAHQNFLRSDGTTRLLGIWRQGAASLAASPVPYGRFYSSTEINKALLAAHRGADPYLALGYGPDIRDPATHGTHVMDIAAGNGRGSGQAGVAPAADIIFVDLASNDIAWSGPDATIVSFGDSAQLLEAVRFIFDQAGDRPCVVNLSLGTNGGPHDGSTLVEQGLDAIVREKPNRAVVIAASNSQADNIHTMGTVTAGASHNIAWQHAGDSGGEFELWYPGASQMEVSLIEPGGGVFGPVTAGRARSFSQGGQVAIHISNRLDDPNNNDNAICIWVAAGIAAGVWTVRLHSPAGDVDYHAWIERFDPAQGSFPVSVASHTLGSISTGLESIVVGSYDAHKSTFPLSYFSSAGPTRDGRSKPEVSAPGHNVLAAKSRSAVGVVRKSGTSMASPAVTGLVALMLAEARRTGTILSITDIRQKLMSGVLLNPPAHGLGRWDPRYGAGRVHANSI